MSNTIRKSMNPRSLMIRIITISLLISAGCLQKDTNISKTNVSKIIKEDKEPEKPVPIEYYVEEKISDLPPQYIKFRPWFSKLNITEEERSEITAQCRRALEQNAERLAREVPTKIPENWARDEVQFKKEKFLMENYTASLRKSDDKMIARFPGTGFNANTSAFNDSVLHIFIENDCVYNLKEKKVEKIRITFWPQLWLE